MRITAHPRTKPILSFSMARLLSTSLAATACGADRHRSTVPSAEITFEDRAPAVGALSVEAAIDLGARIDIIGLSEEGNVLAIAEGEIFEISRTEATRRSLYAAPGDPTALSTVYGVTPRRAGGAWLAAEAGLFALDTHYVTRSPIEAGAVGVRAVEEASAGPLEGLWLGTELGVFLSRPDRFERLRISGVEGRPSGIAVEREGMAALILSGRDVTLLESTRDGLVSDLPPIDVGEVSAVVASESALYAASDRGLVRWRASDSPAWTLFSLSPSGEPPMPVLALAVDPATGDVWARGARTLVRLANDALTAFEARTLAEGEAAWITVDGSGGVWTVASSRLERASPSNAIVEVSFARDVRPWISANCSLCHRNQTQNFEDYDVFSEKADIALARVRAGDMPRCAGGLPCPPEQRLAAETYSVLEEWIRAGKPE